MSQALPGRDWRGGGEAASASGRGLVYTLAFVAAVLLGLIAAWLWRIRATEADAQFISLTLSQYDDPWPPVPYADSDARLLHQVLGGELDVTRQEAERFKERFRNLAELNAGKLIFHVTGLAVADGDTIYILTSQAHPPEADANWKASNAAGWHRLDDLLDAFRRCPAKTGKLLILDVAHPVLDLDCGVSSARVMELLHKALHEQFGGAVEGSPTLVLVSAGPGQISQPMAEAGSSAFAHYLARNLRWPNGHHQHQPITARQLAAATQDQVKRWAQQTRGVSQTPYLVGDGDFMVKFPTADDDFTPLPLAYPDWLFKEWTTRDAIDRQVWSMAPHLARQLDELLVRCDARFRAAVPPATVEQDFQKDGPKLVMSAKRAADVKLPAVKTLEGIEGTPARSKVRTWIEQPDLKAKLADAIADPKIKPEVVLAAAWEEICTLPIERAKLVALINQTCGPPTEADTPEAIFLCLLKRIADEQRFRDGQRTWPSALVREAARAERSYLRARAALTPAAFPALRQRMDALTKQRAEAEKILLSFSEPFRPGKESLDVLERQCLALFQSPEGIEQTAIGLKADADEARASASAAATALAMLPGFVPLMVRLDGGAANGWLEPWERAVECHSALTNLLAGAAPLAPFPRDGLRLQRTELGDKLHVLRKRLTDLVTLENMNGDTVAAVLASPLLSAKERKEFWDRWQIKWCVPKTAAVIENEANYELAREPTPVGASRSNGLTDEQRSRMAVGLARLAGGPDEVRRSAGNIAALWVRPRGPRAGGVFGIPDTTDAPSPRGPQLARKFCQWQAETYSQEAESRGLSVAFYRDAEQAARAAAHQTEAAAPPP